MSERKREEEMKESNKYLREKYTVFLFPLLFFLPTTPFNLNLSFGCRHQSSNYMKQVISAMYGNSIMNLGDHSQDQISVPFFSVIYM